MTAGLSSASPPHDAFLGHPELVLEVLRLQYEGITFTVRDGLYRAERDRTEVWGATPDELVRSVGIAWGMR